MVSLAEPAEQFMPEGLWDIMSTLRLLLPALMPRQTSQLFPATAGKEEAADKAAALATAFAEETSGTRSEAGRRP